MKQLFKKRRTLSASSLLLMSLFLCLFLSVGCSVIKNNAAETPNIFVNEKKITMQKKMLWRRFLVIRFQLYVLLFRNMTG